MNVKLYRQDEADYTIDETKCEKLSFKTLCMLTDYVEHVEQDGVPRMAAFKSTEDFKNAAWKYDIDPNKEILINQNGVIFCYIKEYKTAKKNEKKENAPADTDKN